MASTQHDGAGRAVAQDEDDRPRAATRGADALHPAAGNGAAIERLVSAVLSRGVGGSGPFTSAEEFAEEHLAQHGDVEVAIDRVIATHTRCVAATGFAAGFGGPLAMPVSIPTDVGVFSVLSTRCVAAVAHLRGYDVASDEVRSVVLLTLLGAGGVGLAAELGATLGTKAALSVLEGLPGRTLIEINRKVGFGLLTKVGTKGLVNPGRWVPVVGGYVGAGVNAAAMRTAGRYAMHNFPQS